MAKEMEEVVEKGCPEPPEGTKEPAEVVEATPEATEPTEAMQVVNPGFVAVPRQLAVDVYDFIRRVPEVIALVAQGGTLLKRLEMEPQNILEEAKEKDGGKKADS